MDTKHAIKAMKSIAEHIQITGGKTMEITMEVTIDFKLQLIFLVLRTRGIDNDGQRYII